MKEFINDNFFQLTIVLMGIGICIISLIAINKWEKNQNCYYEKYNEYPCVGATHYARVHRNNNESCERYKKICEEK